MKKMIRKMRRNKKYRKNIISKAFMILAAICIMLIVFTKNGSTADAASCEQNTQMKTFAKYIIDEGDTLWDLALTYGNGVSVTEYISEVKSINHLGNEDYIVSGRILIIPYYYDTAAL